MRAIVPVALLCAAYQLGAQTVTWKDVAPIFYEQCLVCHRPGQIGADYLIATNYTTLVNSPFFYSIPPAVQSRKMPPWPADPHYVRYLNERILSPDQIDKITKWFDEGTPKGDTTLAPSPPSFPEGSVLGIPDLTLTMSEPYFIPGDYVDRYMVFVLPSHTTEDKQLRAIEFVPGNPLVVHHVFLYFCTDNSADSLDQLTPEYGYPSFGGAGEGANVDFITLYGPGMAARYYPPGTGLKFKKGTKVVIQMHYAPTNTPQTDQSKVNLFFGNTLDFRPVKGKRVGENYIIEPVFFILKNHILTFHSQFVLDTTYSLFSIAPHMHLLGKEFKIFAKTPSGDSIPLNRVYPWNFNWQLLYEFNHFVILPKGTVIHAEATYDNTSNNPFNPSNPPKNVGYGESSFDEMFKYFMNLVVYEPGDELVVFDTTWQPVPIGVDEIDPPVQTPQLYDPIPNPAHNAFSIDYFLPERGQVRIFVYDAFGRLALPWQHHANLNAGFHKTVLSVTDLPSGLYFVTLDTGNKRLTKELVVQR